MRAMWRGAISFGMVNIAIRLYAAAQEHDFRFHQVHRADGGRIHYRRVCSACNQEVEFPDIVKGYELEDGRMIVLNEKDFEQLPIKTDRAIEVLEFVAIEEIDPIFFQKSYYLEPDKTAARPYVLLREALEQTGRLAVVKISLRQRETLAMLRARDDVLVLHTMLWPDEVRRPDFDFLNDEVSVRRQELEMATSLVENMSGEFKPDEFRDDYRVALEALIAAKAEGAEPPAARPDTKSGGEVIDLMAALENSVKQAKQARGEQDVEEKSDKKSARSSAGASSDRGRSRPAKKSESAAAPKRSRTQSRGQGDAKKKSAQPKKKSSSSKRRSSDERRAS